MKKQLSLMFAGTVLSATVLGACTNRSVNDNNVNRNAPMRIDNPNRIDTPDNRNLNNLDRNNINKDNINNRNNNLNNNYYPPSEDKNTDTDKDIIKDYNTKQEDIIEDDIDVKDRDRKDE